MMMVLLDWEKAFDKIKPAKIFEALKRLRVHEDLIEKVQALYRCPTFEVQIDGTTSSQKSQSTGIRQGCPLSPYLFIAAMTVLFKDLEAEDHNGTWLHRPDNLNATSILYADDTILLCQDTPALNKYLQELEIAAEKYGLRLNKSKCELLVMGAPTAQVRFADGSRVPQREIAKYLGIMLSKKAQIELEIDSRVTATAKTWRAFGEFWKNSNCSTRLKILVYETVIHSKLLYGLESAQLTAAQQRKLNTFQYKGLRQILKISTTYIDRSHTNAFVLQRARQAMIRIPPVAPNAKKRKKLKSHRIHTLDVLYQKRKCKLLAAILRAPADDPIRFTTLRDLNATPFINSSRRVGRPRQIWVTETAELLYQSFLLEERARAEAAEAEVPNPLVEREPFGDQASLLQHLQERVTM